ncbi:hypothetical protein FHT08_003276 [Xanthomonas campestris]|uniref:hypothetical protein n=1 Tax=Xanthomonas sp. CFBP 8151 TaxID=3035310 RepID=UPI00141A79A1|nr:hypothetical protein [Xanthomonas sp. CFBP 8151]NIJ78156.1 hypothetical protein [Xanthomonas sp. CFBP 8151]
MKLPNTQDVAEMLAHFDMAIEETADGLRVFWRASNKEYGCFTGPGAFLDHWGESAAKGIYESRKLDLVRQIYRNADESSRAKLLYDIRSYFLDNKSALKSRLSEVEWTPSGRLEVGWVGQYAKVLAAPRGESNFDIGILDSMAALDPALEGWAAETRRELRRWVGLPIE